MNSHPRIVTHQRIAKRCAMLLWCALLGAGISPSAAQTGAWKPTRPVEIIVGVSPGGGLDRTARTIQKILQDNRYIDVAASVINKPGGGSTIAQTYLNQHAGDAHYLYIAATSLLTNHILGKSVQSHKDFTAIAMLSDDYIGFAVHADSPLKSAKDLLDVLRSRPESLPIGIASAAGNTNHIAAGIVAKAAGSDVKKLRVVIFGSGGEAMTAAVGGHVGWVATPATNLVAHVQAGRLRALAVAAPLRLSGALAAVPTWRELNVNAVVANWRPVIGARGLSAAQTAFWDEIIAKVTRTEAWRKEIESAGGVNHYMNSRELTNYFDAQYAEFKNILGDLGLSR